MQGNRFTRSVGAVVLAAGVVAVAASPAYAAPPSNDTFAGAIPIEVPFKTQLDTTEATTDADDAEANVTCGAPATDASVWYSLTPSEDKSVAIELRGSSYTAGALVVVGAPGSFEIVACGPGAIAFPVTAGTTYYLMIIDDQADGGGNGGDLVMTVFDTPPAPRLTTTVDPSGGFDPKDGSATVRGTISCAGAEFAFVEAELHQRVGRGEVVGIGVIDVVCDRTPQPWSLQIFPTFGQKFSGGKAASLTFSVACGTFECSVDFQEHIVQLSRR